MDGFAPGQGDCNTVEVKCPICFDSVRGNEVVKLFCLERHPFCITCLKQHIASVPFPRCPSIGCGYELEESDIAAVCGNGEHMEEFRKARLQRAVARLHGKVTCPNPDCANVVVCDPETRTRVVCQCGWAPFCSCCRQPYHYHSECGAVQPLRSRWLRWLMVDRAEYHEHIEDFKTVCKKRRSVVQEAFVRHRELEVDEEWKAKSCRLCPKCFRTIEKVSGCNSMVCGRNYHGGNDQQGCGHAFDWSQAPPYQPRVERMHELPEMDEAAARLHGASVQHFFSMCSLCQKSIRGPRLRCIHCEVYDCCLDCELKLADVHPPEHVFEIILKPDNPINEDLPIGTEVEVFGLEGAAAALNGVSANVLRYLPDAACYELDLPMGGAPFVPAANVQPARIDNGAAAQDILERSLAQRDARRFSLGLSAGARVQLGAVIDKPELHNALASVVRYFPAGDLDYVVQLDNSKSWTCQSCTLINDAQVQTCNACGRPRGTATLSGAIRVRASDISPIISDASQVKALAQCHWAEQQRLEKVMQANACASMGSLDLPKDQLVRLHVDKDSLDAGGLDGVRDADGSLATVLFFDAWSREYKVRLEVPDATIEMSGGFGRKWPASACKPCYCLSPNPLAAVQDSAARHSKAVSVLQDVQAVHDSVKGTYLGLAEGQWVLVPSVDPAAQETWARGVIGVYKPEQGMYTVFPYGSGGSWGTLGRDVDCNLVMPVLWASEDPHADAILLAARHEAESSRLRLADQMAVSHTQSNLDLSPGAWAILSQEDGADVLAQVKSFDSWRCTYVVAELQKNGCRTSHRVDVALVRPSFRSSPNPVTAAADVRIRHAAELSRRLLVVEANVLAEKVRMGLPVGQLLEINGSDPVTHLQVRSYNPVDTSYAVSLWTIDGKLSEIKTFAKSENVRPVFWHSSDPLLDARIALERDKNERSRLDSCAQAEMQARSMFLGLPLESLVYVRHGEETSSSLSKAQLWTIRAYSPEISSYTVRKYGNWASIASSDDFIRTVSWEFVEPCFTDAADPFIRAAEISAQHAAEHDRLREVEAAHAASAAHGFFFDLAPGQHVELQGEGVWRRPSIDHSGRGTVVRYISEKRAYDIKLEIVNRSWSGSADILHLVKACHIKPIFWQSTSATNDLQTLCEAHEVASKRFRVALAAADRCKHANLNLPVEMLVVVKGEPRQEVNGRCPRLATVFAYNRVTKSYQLCNIQTAGDCAPMQFHCRCVPAEHVQPYVWSDKSPTSIAAQAMEAHDAELQRLLDVEAATAELVGCTLGFPLGLPVRLLRPAVTQSSPGTAMLSGQESWGVWFKRRVEAWRPIPGAAAGDIAIICGNDANGTYDLQLLEDAGSSSGCCSRGLEPGTVAITDLQQGCRVQSIPEAYLQPLLVLADMPQTAAERLWQLHDEASSKQQALKHLLPRASQMVPLALPRGTVVEAAQHGRCVVLSYDAAVPGYYLRAGAGKPCTGVLCPASNVRVALHNHADPAAALAEFEALTNEEERRLEEAKEANRRASTWHEGLPCGTRVNLASSVQLPAGDFRNVGKVTGRCTIGYLVQVEAAAGALSFSSESFLEVRAALVSPTFYYSKQPLADVEALRLLLSPP